ncbi:MAG: DUF1883 domain-containing protein [Acidobacteriota bacterium]
MSFLHYTVQTGPGDVVQVSLDKQANVLLLDQCAFQNFKSGRRYQYRGGLAKQSPVCLRAPYLGTWKVVVNLGGYPGTVRASCRVVRAA